MNIILLLCHEPDFCFIRKRLEHFEEVFDLIFVHYDAKSDESVYQKLLDYENNNNKVCILKDREKVYWGGVSQIKATVNGIALIKKIVKGNFHLFLCSTTHVVLREINNDDIREPHIQGSNMPLPIILKRMLLPFSEINKTTYFNPVTILSNMIRLILIYLKFGKPIWGSQWISCQADLLDCEKLRKHIELFDNMKIPDEMFFQTVLRQHSSESLTYFLFSSDNSGSPETFTKSSLKNIDKKYLFARKVFNI